MRVPVPTIKAVIFDFGRVISAARPDAVFERYEDELGLVRGSINRIMFEAPAWQEALVGRLSMEEYWYRIGPSLGLTSPDAVDRFRRRYYGDEAVDRVVLDLIQTLHGRFRLAVLSNHPPGLGPWLEDWAIQRYFDVVYGSGDEGCAKPDPAAYRTVLERLGVVPPEAVFIDDTAGHVAAARELGLHGIVFTHARQLARDLATLLPTSGNGREAAGSGANPP
ncbi:MAG: HAD family phosphatase [Desulfobacterales bacterium]|nr:HAD family phosphatase [Desulfobacterales bacterium]